MEEEEDNNHRKIILASSSPRRKKILEKLRVDYESVKPEGVEEKVFKNPYKTVLYNSSLKAKIIYNHDIISNPDYGRVLIAGFDTIVFINKRILTKPSGYQEAFNFLRTLSGRKHKVITGVTVIDGASGSVVQGTETTDVFFRDLEELEINEYLKNTDVLDKAGAYDISGDGAIFIKRVNGCFYNVAGLPVYRFLDLIKRFDYKIF